MVGIFMTPQPLLRRGEKSDTVLPLSEDKSAESRTREDSKTPGSKNQETKVRKMQRAADIKLRKAKEKGTVSVTGVDV